MRAASYLHSLLAGICLALACAGTAATAEPHAVRDVVGWTVRIHPDLAAKDVTAVETALGLLERQLRAIIAALPPDSVARLREVPLWFSPPYQGIGPRAEYHPSADWLRDNGRDPAMARAIEFTNIAVFPAETRRMPNFALHELAHAWHDRVLGFETPEIRLAHEAAVKAGTYARVPRRDSEGREHLDRAYALTNHKEYFAELTEALFAANDFFPFVRAELERHDPLGAEVVARAWNATPPAAITPPPASLKLPPFYRKYIAASGYPIIASERVSDHALREAAWLVDRLLSRRPDIREALIEGGSRMNVIAWNEFTTDLPDFAALQPKNYWDARARGTGGSEDDPACSCAEENVLSYPGDPYATECILIHEFAHTIHLRGLRKVDPGFDGRLRETYQKAMAAGLWKNCYAATNPAEYFAEGVQSWFDDNRENDAVHNHVNTRAELEAYDPGLAALCREVFRDTVLRYTKAPTRRYGHLVGYDPSKAPTFTWPERLLEARQDIKRKVEQRPAAPPTSKN